jgi:sugar transferase (PEP-CTERM system associated)
VGLSLYQQVTVSFIAKPFVAGADLFKRETWIDLLMRTIRIFGHYIRLQILLLAMLEALIFIASIYVGALMRFVGDIYAAETEIGWLLPRAIVFASVMVSSMAALGLYQPNQRERILGTALRISISFLVGSIAMAVCFYIFPGIYIGRGTFGLATAVSFLGIVTVRAISLSPIGENLFRRRVLVLGTGAKASSILKMRRRADWRGVSLIGFVHVRGEPDVVDPSKVLTIDKPLMDFAIEQEIDQIVVALDERRSNFPIDELLKCRMNGIDVLDIFTFFEHEFGKIRLDMLQPSHLIFSDGFQPYALYPHIKRIFDIVMSLLLLTIAWPIMAVTALAILSESGGTDPILYRQLRVSQGGKLFNILKFRSMRVDAEHDQHARWSEANDSRVTRVGAVIRKFRIDELPQVFNVLCGDMSFVGPRPERPEFVSQLTKTIPLYAERHQVKAGISGWAQLCYPYGSSEKDAREKLQYDLYYVKNNSLFLDLLILLQTAEVVLFRKGAR